MWAVEGKYTHIIHKPAARNGRYAYIMSSFREKTNDALREWLRSKLLPTHGKKSVLLERYTPIICYFMPYYLSVVLTKHFSCSVVKCL